jgi:hypothetical protein
MWSQTADRNGKQKNGISTRTTKQSPRQQSRTHDSNVQKPLHFNSVRNRPRQTGTAGRNPIEHDATAPAISAYEQIHWPFDYNKTPIAPLGHHLLVHVKPEQRDAWDPRAEKAFYIGPAMKHYRCLMVHVTETDATHITDTLTWLPGITRVPIATPEDAVIDAIGGLETAIQALLDKSSLAKDRKQNCYITHANKPIFPITNRECGRVALMLNNAREIRVAGPKSKPIKQQPTPPETTAPLYLDISGTRGKKLRQQNRKRNKPELFRENEAAIATEAPIAAPTAAPAPVYLKRDEVPGMPTEYFACYGHAINPDTKTIADYPTLIKSSEAQHWIGAMEDEWGRLMERTDWNPNGKRTMRNVKLSDIPRDIIPMYVRVVVAFRPEKENPYRIRLTVGGDRVIFEGECSTKAANLVTVKILLNSVLSTLDAKFATLDIKDFYLNTTMPYKDRVYMRIPERLIL